MMWLDGPEVIHDGQRRREGDLLIEGNVSLQLANDLPSRITRLLPSKVVSQWLFFPHHTYR